jgi:hypothetical protein
VINISIKIFERFNVLADEMYMSLSNERTNPNYNELVSLNNLLYLAFDTIKNIPFPKEVKRFMQLVSKFEYTLDSLTEIMDGTFDIVDILNDMNKNLEPIKDMTFLHISKLTKDMENDKYFATYDYLNYVPASTTSFERIENVSLKYGGISDDLTSNKSILFSTEKDGSININENPHIKTIVNKIMKNKDNIIEYNKINITESCMLKNYNEYNYKIRPKNIDVIN